MLKKETGRISDKRAIAYLVYYDKSKNFYIEIDSNADKSNMPMMFALFAEKGEYSIDSRWSKKWVCSRIIPPDRQNLGQIMRI